MKECFWCHDNAFARGYCARHYAKARHMGIFTVEASRGPQGFWAKVDKSAGPQGCWERSGFHDKDGYAKFNQTRAHVYSLGLVLGRKPEGLVLHLCDNPGCVNPLHLMEGTQKENRQQAAKRGRTSRGSTHHTSRLSEMQVREIREKTKIIHHGIYADLAREYGVRPSSIRQIVLRQSWSWLD